MVQSTCATIDHSEIRGSSAEAHRMIVIRRERPRTETASSSELDRTVSSRILREEVVLHHCAPPLPALVGYAACAVGTVRAIAHTKPSSSRPSATTIFCFVFPRRRRRR